MTSEERKDVEHLQALFASIKVPTLCRSCGTNLDYNQCFCKPEPVATVERCELGEHCRCKSFDVAYKADCWNWIGEVKP